MNEIPIRKSTDGTYRITKDDKDYIKRFAVDGVLPFSDYVKALTQILNQQKMDTVTKEGKYRAEIRDNLKRVDSTGDLQTLNKLTLLYSNWDQLSEQDYVKGVLIYYIMNRDFAVRDLQIIASLVEKISIDKEE